MSERYFSQSNAHERTHSLCTVCWEQSTEGSRYKDVCTTCDLSDKVAVLERTISAARTKLSAISSVLLVAQRAGGEIKAETIMPLVDKALAELKGAGALEELRKDDEDG